MTHLKSSRKPGSTKFLTFYSFSLKSSSQRELVLVDLPGYGYGSTNQQGATIEEYLRSTSTLRVVYLLIDSNVHIKKTDLMVVSLLNQYNVAWHVVGTKWDKNRTKSEKGTDSSMRHQLQRFVVEHGRSASEHIFATSSKSSIGIDELRQSILKSIDVI